MAPEVDSDDENVEYEDDSGHRYRLYLDELEGGSRNNAPGDSASPQGKWAGLAGSQFHSGTLQKGSGASAETLNKTRPLT